MEKKRGRKPKAKGLGDTVENILAATHVDKVAKWLFGDDCGCEERKKKLNEIFPYRKMQCLEEDEYNVLKRFFSRDYAEVKVSDQNELLKVYNRVFSVKQEPTSCADCWREIVNKLKQVYKEYEDANTEA